MTKLYRSKPLAFALIWIAVYVVGMSLADGLSEALDVEKLVTLPLCAVLCLVFGLWVARNGLRREFGLCRPKGSAGSRLWYLPLVLLVSVNLWGGVQLNLSPLETLLYVLSMLCVGFLEEVIFRGMLFRAMAPSGLRAAVIISSVSFGIGHIVNLLGGAEILPTLLQILYATAAGFMFTAIFMRSGSLLPCIIAHSTLNALSAFGVERGLALDMVSAAVLTVVSFAYGAWILKQKQV